MYGDEIPVTVKNTFISVVKPTSTSAKRSASTPRSLKFQEQPAFKPNENEFDSDVSTTWSQHESFDDSDDDWRVPLVFPNEFQEQRGLGGYRGVEQMIALLQLVCAPWASWIRVEWVGKRIFFRIAQHRKIPPVERLKELQGILRGSVGGSGVCGDPDLDEEGCGSMKLRCFTRAEEEVGQVCHQLALFGTCPQGAHCRASHPRCIGIRLFVL